MKTYIFIIVSLFCGLTVFPQENYLNTQFVKDKKVLKKEAYKDIKKGGFYKERDSLRIAFIYCFKDIDFVKSDINNNQYLNQIEPRYRYFNYILFPLFKNKFPTKKRLRYDGYVLDENNKIVALMGCGIETYKFRPYPHSEIYDNEYENLVQNVLTQEFDLCFYTGLMGFNRIWCVKGNETFIYDIAQQHFWTLTEFFDLQNQRKVF